MGTRPLNKGPGMFTKLVGVLTPAERWQGYTDKAISRRLLGVFSGVSEAFCRCEEFLSDLLGSYGF